MTQNKSDKKVIRGFDWDACNTEGIYATLGDVFRAFAKALGYEIDDTPPPEPKCKTCEDTGTHLVTVHPDQFAVACPDCSKPDEKPEGVCVKAGMTINCSGGEYVVAPFGTHNNNITLKSISIWNPRDNYKTGYLWICSSNKLTHNGQKVLGYAKGES